MIFHRLIDSGITDFLYHRFIDNMAQKSFSHHVKCNCVTNFDGQVISPLYLDLGDDGPRAFTLLDHMGTIFLLLIGFNAINLAVFGMECRGSSNS